MSGSVGKALHVLVLTLLFLLASCVTLAAGILLGQDLVVAASIVLSVVAAALLIVAIRQQREVVPATAKEKTGRRRAFDDPQPVSPVSAGPEHAVSQQSLAERTSFTHRERNESDAEATMLLPRVNPATRSETHHSVVPPLPPLTEQARITWDEQETVKQAPKHRSVQAPTVVPQSELRHVPPPNHVTEPGHNVEPDHGAGLNNAAGGPNHSTEPNHGGEWRQAPAGASTPNHTFEPALSSPVSASEPGDTSEAARILDSEKSAETQVMGKTSSVQQATTAQQAILTQQIGTSELVEESAEEEFDDPPDEPAAELLLSSEERRVAQLNDDVMVVDGRPRYHVSGCTHLADKASQPLPASEAVELGFTPCSACSAATTLLTRDS